MDFTVIDPGFPLWPIILCAIITILTCSIAGGLHIADKVDGDVWFPITTLLIVVWAFVGIIGGNAAYSGTRFEAKVAQIEKLGFEYVDLDDDRLTANLDGKFFVGVVAQIAPDTYRILELEDTE